MIWSVGAILDRVAYTNLLREGTLATLLRQGDTAVRW